MIDEHFTLDYWDIPTDGSFIAVNDHLEWNGHKGIALFDLFPNMDPTNELERILNDHGAGPIENILYTPDDPFFTVTRTNLPDIITVYPQAWLGKALLLPDVLSTFRNHPFLNIMLIFQKFFLKIKEEADNNIIIGLYQDKLMLYKSRFFDSFADFFGIGYFENMLTFAIMQMAEEKLLLNQYGEEEIFDTLIKYTPVELISRPIDKLKHSFIALASYNKK